MGVGGRFLDNAPWSGSGLSRPYLLGEGARGAVAPTWAAQEADAARKGSRSVRRRAGSAPLRAVTGLRTRWPRGHSTPEAPSHVPHIEVLVLSLTTPSRTPSGEGVVRERPIRPAQGSLTTTIDRSVFAAGPSADQVSRPRWKRTPSRTCGGEGVDDGEGCRTAALPACPRTDRRGVFFSDAFPVVGRP
jgi:hypothetical protein